MPAESHREGAEERPQDHHVRPNTRHEHIQSDTFFGLRIEIYTEDESSTVVLPQKALRKALRKEGIVLDKQRMTRRATMKSLVYNSATK